MPLNQIFQPEVLAPFGDVVQCFRRRQELFLFCLGYRVPSFSVDLWSVVSALTCYMYVRDARIY